MFAFLLKALTVLSYGMMLVAPVLLVFYIVRAIRHDMRNQKELSKERKQ